MAETRIPYQRLARSRFGMSGIGTLWLGPDHLLLVTNTFAVERYRRWFFREIQALTARRSARRLIWNVAVGGGGLLIAIGALACFAGASQPGAAGDRDALQVFGWIFAVMAGACFALALVNTLLGPGCTIHVQTPFGVERLSVPNRLGAFRKILARIEPLLEAAQIRSEPSAGSAVTTAPIAPAPAAPITPAAAATTAPAPAVSAAPIAPAAPGTPPVQP
jgi:hypothetical protein